MIEGLDHVVLYSGDAEATLAFYRDVLGCRILREAAWRGGDSPVFGIQLGSEGSYINVHPNGRELHPRAAYARPGTLDLCARVDLTPAEVAERLARHHIDIEVGPAPRRDAFGLPSQSIYFRDPDDNLIELMSRCTEEAPTADPERR
jgi:catechol 2,3-dioxygenase-like lactoylglutathione lyase family enzyme